MESLFAAKAPGVRKAAVAAKPITEVEIIASNRAQNIMIMMGRLKKYSCTDLRVAVLKLDPEVLTENIARQFISNAASSDEIILLRKFVPGTVKLRQAEEFLLEMIKINGFVPRLSAYNFKLGYSERIRSIERDITLLSRALDSLLTSIHFSKLLNLILTLGNYLNSGGFQGVTHGFQISSLNMLSSTKSTDGKSSLLSFLVDSVDTSFPELLGFLDEIRPVIDAAGVSSIGIREELSEMRNSLRSLDEEIARQEGDEALDVDRFLDVMRPFQSKSRVEITAVCGSMQAMNESYTIVASLYAEQDSTVKVEEFLSVFRSFMVSFSVYPNTSNNNLDSVVFKSKTKRTAAGRPLSKGKGGGEAG
jgi:hypothetical protein